MSTSKHAQTSRATRSRRPKAPPPPTQMHFAPGAQSDAPETLTAAVRRALTICAHLGADDPYPDPEALADVHGAVEKVLNELEVLASSIVRVRDPQYGDRRVKVEYFADPTRPAAVLMRFEPATQVPVVIGKPERITTSEAASLLGLSRPHVAMLCDQGHLGPVEITQGGQRRVLREMVMAYREASLRQRRALDEMLELTEPLLEKELVDARRAAARKGVHWGSAKQLAGQSAKRKPSKGTKSG